MMLPKPPKPCCLISSGVLYPSSKHPTVYKIA